MSTDPDHEYDIQLDRLANSLHALADQVRNEGDATRVRYVGISSERRPIDRTILASDVHDAVMHWVGQKNSHLTCLMFAAIRAEHATARSTPAELLDQAATGLDSIMGAADATAEEMAELALRGAGVIR